MWGKVNLLPSPGESFQNFLYGISQCYLASDGRASLGGGFPFTGRFLDLLKGFICNSATPPHLLKQTGTFGVSKLGVTVIPRMIESV